MSFPFVSLLNVCVRQKLAKFLCLAVLFMVDAFFRLVTCSSIFFVPGT